MISRRRRVLLGLVAVLVGVALIPSGSRTQEPPELGAIASHGLTLLPNARLLISGGTES